MESKSDQFFNSYISPDNKDPSKNQYSLFSGNDYTKNIKDKNNDEEKTEIPEEKEKYISIFGFEKNKNDSKNKTR